MGHRIQLPGLPVRIVSLVPSQTELLFDLGLAEEVVGITKYCIHPPQWRKEKSIVGGTKDFDLEAIDHLQPNLIIGNKEENFRDGILALQKKYPVWMSDIYALDDALQMILEVGSLVGRGKQSQSIAQQIQSDFEAIKPFRKQKVLYLIWRKPWMAAAQNTFINSILQKIGLENCASHENRYPQYEKEALIALDPELVMLSSEPYPFKEKHVDEVKAMFPNAKIFLVDGEMFSWYGSRLLKAKAYFEALPF